MISDEVGKQAIELLQSLLQFFPNFNLNIQ